MVLDFLRNITSKQELVGKTVLFVETFYFIKCGKCSREDGAYYDKPPKKYKCGICGHTSLIEKEAERRPRY